MKKICVLGANGRVSREVALAFHRAGWQVTAVTRDGNAKDLPRGISQAKGDAMNANELIAACTGADVIFNGLNPPYTQWRKLCLPMAENVIAAAKAAGAVHLFIGNIYNYGPEIPQICDETTPFAAQNGKGGIRNQMEALFKQASTKGVQTIVLRAGDFYGSGKGAWFDLEMTKSLAKGKFIYPGPVDVAHAWAYLPDLAEAFVKLAEKADQLPVYESYTFAGHTMTGRQMMQYCQLASGKTLSLGKVPWRLLRFLALFLPMMREIVEVSYLWHRPHALDGKKLEKAIGATKSTSPQEAVARALFSLSLIDETPPMGSKKVDAGIA